MMAKDHERRGHPRYKTNFAVGIEGSEKKGRLGVVQDASAHGVLLNTGSRFAANDEVVLTLHAIPGCARVKARLVRVEEVKRESPYPWRYLAAAVFDQPLPELEAILAAPSYVGDTPRPPRLVGHGLSVDTGMRKTASGPGCGP
jgi:hypothetical protein